MRVARSRELVAQGRPAALVARVAGISRQAIYRRPRRPPAGQRRPLDQVDRVVLAVARANPTDGTRMVAALAGRELGGPVNRKRVQRLMREHRLLQRHRSEGRRRRPGFFRVEHPDQLWHLDMTSVWVAEHGWCYLNARDSTAARARSPAGRSTSAAAHRRRSPSSSRAPRRGIEPGELTLGTDNGSAFTSRAFRAASASSGSRTAAAATATPRARRSSSPGSPSSSSACIWRERVRGRSERGPSRESAAYVDHYHPRPHSRLA
jgi:putative transposase